MSGLIQETAKLNSMPGFSTIENGCERIVSKAHLATYNPSQLLLHLFLIIIKMLVLIVSNHSSL